jgi:hypothetical protein
MWLLDVNMPRQLKALLADLGITADTANDRGWGTLVNGDLLEAAAAAGFKCLLTRDRLFGQSASSATRIFRSCLCCCHRSEHSSSWPPSKRLGNKARLPQLQGKYNHGREKPLGDSRGGVLKPCVLRSLHFSGSMPILSFTASFKHCLHPKYFSVVCTETWPSRN